MTALTIRGLAKSFGATPVLTGLDLDVPAESLTAVLGPSGCGKTTLLRLVAGFLRPDAGTVALGDTEVAGPGRFVPAQRRRVGYVPQEGALFPHLDVAGNILFGLPGHARRSRERLDELLDLVGLDARLARQYPHELSGGQQQRVALARALAPRPSVVLLDEPFSSLDAGLRESTGRAVAEVLRGARATAVLVTHDQGEALSLADQVAVMREGRLVQVGSPRTVYRAPADAGVATFLGAAVLLPAEVDGAVARCVLGTVAVEQPVAVTPGSGTVLIRPEQLVLATGPDTGSTGGAAARVREVAFFGHDAAVHLDVLPDGPQVLARVVGHEIPEPGDTVRVTVRGPVPVIASPSEHVADIGEAAR